MARLTLDLSDTHIALIEKLQKMCDLTTKKDVIQEALMILGWAASEVVKGNQVGSFDSENNVLKQITTSALEGAKHQSVEGQKN